ncbi:heterogeneous nuclear ribonucleoprotein Q-like isoform X1 [Chenopodium quinoa]|nr:heterogeneous nuclear ribonucleoprotein Q-like isoform X1 [Chenopodium quinoa]
MGFPESSQLIEDLLILRKDLHIPVMAEGSEIDERVDLDDDNYMEETDEDVVDGIEDEAEEGIGDDKAEEQDEELRTDGSGKEQSSEPDQSPIGDEHGEDEEKYPSSISEEDKEKHAELLSLPPYGAEVFIGGLPKDVTEEDLRDLCEPFGEIFEVKLIKNKDTGEFKGYAFVAFKTKEDAQKAIEELKNKEFKGKTVRCSLSDAKHRLFIGNIPKSWSEDQFKQMIHEVGPGAEIIDLKQDGLNPGRNRGFAFIEYYNNACADYARQKMSSGSFKLEGNTPTVTWADPKSAPDSAAASQVKALYVKNIPESATPEQLKEIFQRHGEVTKVVLPPAKGGQGKGSFGFIHFGERSSALKAVKDTEKYEIDGQALEVTMAKPQTDKKSEAAASFTAGSNYLPPQAYGFAGNPYGSVGAGYGVAGGYQQPMIYGRGPMPAGMQMVPMVLPDGRIGYVLQQPGMQMAAPVRPRRNDRTNGSGGPQGRGNGSGNDRTRRFRPY